MGCPGLGKTRGYNSRHSDADREWLRRARQHVGDHSKCIRSRRHRVHSGEWRRRRRTFPQALGVRIGLIDRSRRARFLRLQCGPTAVSLQLLCSATDGLMRFGSLFFDNGFASSLAVYDAAAAYVTPRHQTGRAFPESLAGSRWCSVRVWHRLLRYRSIAAMRRDLVWSRRIRTA